MTGRPRGDGGAGLISREMRSRIRVFPTVNLRPGIHDRCLAIGSVAHRTIRAALGSPSMALPLSQVRESAHDAISRAGRTPPIRGRSLTVPLRLDSRSTAQAGLPAPR